MGEKGLTFKESTDKHLGILLQEIAHTHSNYWTYKVYVEELPRVGDEAIRKVLTRVCLLFGLNKILE